MVLLFLSTLAPAEGISCPGAGISPNKGEVSANPDYNSAPVNTRLADELVVWNCVALPAANPEATVRFTL